MQAKLDCGEETELRERLQRGSFKMQTLRIKKKCFNVIVFSISEPALLSTMHPPQCPSRPRAIYY